jgi:hypothetical protein
MSAFCSSRLGGANTPSYGRADLSFSHRERGAGRFAGSTWWCFLATSLAIGLPSLIEGGYVEGVAKACKSATTHTLEEPPPHFPSGIVASVSEWSSAIRRSISGTHAR